jgi:hypothetical protein
MAPFVAPSAERTASSRCRTMRASSRFATVAAGDAFLFDEAAAERERVAVAHHPEDPGVAIPQCEDGDGKDREPWRPAKQPEGKSRIAEGCGHGSSAFRPT